MPTKKKETGEPKEVKFEKALERLEKSPPERLEFPNGGLPFEGIRWRRDERLKINFLWVLLYITKAPQDHVSKVWFDNIVVAKDYIGPIELNEP